MAQKDDDVISVPYQDVVVEHAGKLSWPWERFFRNLYSAISPLGIEKSFSLLNNHATPIAIDGLQFDKSKTNCVMIDFLIQRVSRGPDGVEHIETGTLHIAYRPRTGDWAIARVGGLNANTAGVTFTINEKGQVFAATSNLAGDFNQALSKISFRARTLSAKYVEPKFGWEL